MFGKKVKGYILKKFSKVYGQNKYVFLLTMKDDSMVIATEGNNIVGGQVRLTSENAETFYNKMCAEIGAVEVRQ